MTAPSLCAPQGYPPRKDMVRAVSLRTGYVVRGTGERSCCVTYLAQVDPKGGLMGSGMGWGIGVGVLGLGYWDWGWDGVMGWDGMGWEGVNGTGWDGMGVMGWDGMGWDEIR